MVLSSINYLCYCGEIIYLQDLANTTVVSYDPLPPSDSVAAYLRPQR